MDADVIFLPTNKARIYDHLHSSLLNLHSVLGISAIFLLVYILIKGMQKSLVYVALVVVVLLRSSTDIGLFFSPFDALLWLLVL